MNDSNTAHILAKIEQLREELAELRQQLHAVDLLLDEDEYGWLQRDLEYDDPAS